MPLIAHYPLNGDAKDSLGKHDGSVTSVSWANGKIGQAASFNGTSSRIILGNLGKPFQGSISLWYKKNTTGSAEYLMEGRTASSWWLLTHYDGYDVNFLNKVRYNGVPVNVWTHVAVTASPERTQMFINGVLVDTGTGLEMDFRSVRVGTRYTNSGYLDGMIDDIRLYDHVLSEREVKDLAEAPALTKLLEEQDNTSDNGTFITVPDAPAVLGDMTIAFWLYPTSTRRQTIWNNGYGGEGTINFESTGKFLRIYSGPNGGNGSGYQSWESSALPMNTWTHAVAVRDMASQQFRWYLNGQLDTTGSFTFTSVGETKFDLSIGTGYTSAFVGKLKEVKQFSSALDASQIENLYKTGLAIDDHHRMHSTYLNELFEFDYLSPKSSSEVASAGNGYNATSGESDPCSGLLTFDDAVAYAEARGARLPTKAELENDATKGTGCSYDYEFCWSCTKGNDDNEHWVVAGDSTRGIGAPYIKSNTETAYVRFVFDNDLDRPDPVTIDDAAVQKVVGSGATKIERGSTKKDRFSEVGVTSSINTFIPFTKQYADIALGSTLDESNTGHSSGFTAVDGKTGINFSGVAGDDARFNLVDGFNEKDDWTVSFFIYPRRFDGMSSYPIFITFMWSPYIAVNSASSGIRVSYRNSSGSQINYTSSGLLSVNEWAMVTVSHDSVNQIIRIYKNGKIVGEKTSVGALLNNKKTQFNIGNYTGASYFTDGVMSNLKIFDKALTPEEVAQEYSASTKSSINNSTAFAKEFIEV